MAKHFNFLSFMELIHEWHNSYSSQLYMIYSSDITNNKQQDIE